MQQKHQGMTCEGREYRDGATPYLAWCKHYGYDPQSEQARQDYDRYRDQLALFEGLPTDQADRPD